MKVVKRSWRPLGDFEDCIIRVEDSYDISNCEVRDRVSIPMVKGTTS